MRNRPFSAARPRCGHPLRSLAPLLALGLLAVQTRARADNPTPTDVTTESPETLQAREAFLKGIELVRKTQWAEALAAFERSSKLRPHAVTTYNIGTCERALGRYTRARAVLRRALAENDASGRTLLSDSLVTDINGLLAQIDGLLATAHVTLEPPGASIAVDGRPLDVATPAGESVPLLVAGLRAPAPSEAPPAASFTLVLDPGAHVLTLSRKGYADAIVNRTLAPGSTTKLALLLDKLPATLHVACDQAGAAVAVNGVDVGVAPVDVSRPAGRYRVVVKKPGHVTYETEVVAHAGESADLRATLPEEKPPLTSRWWFWTAAGIIVSGVAVSTYVVTRTDSEPVRPPLNGGGLGWNVPVQ